MEQRTQPPAPGSSAVLLPPSPFESWFLSTAHDPSSLDLILDAARSALT